MYTWLSRFSEIPVLFFKLSWGQESQVGVKIHVSSHTLKNWKNSGLIRGYAYNDKLECLYEPSGDFPEKGKWKYSVRKQQTASCAESYA
jgi:hypothetical protein